MLLSVSDDKTARLWDTLNGRLIHTMRVPMLDGYEGQLYSGAISPDEKFVAVGGFTGLLAGSGQAVVYIFDTASGRLIGRLDGLARFAVENIAFSHDGQVLAICQGGEAGVMLFDWQGKRLLLRDDEPDDKIHGAQFSPNGDFAMSTLDGRLWLYSKASGYQQRRITTLRGGQRPMHVQFSPDGGQIVVGYDDVAAFEIVNPATGESLYSMRLPVESGQSGLHVVEWSADGEVIYAGGEPSDDRRSPIYAFRSQGRGPAEPFVVSARRISDIRRMPDGAIAFSSGVPEIGIVEASGQVRWRHTAVTLDMGSPAARWSISDHGDSLAFSSDEGRNWHRFSVHAPPEAAMVLSSGDSGRSFDDVPAAPGWKVDVADGGEALLVNGVPASLDQHERVLWWAPSPDLEWIAAGTNWSIRALDGKAKEKWRAHLVSEVRRLAITRDGSFVIAAVGDGTVRWYRADNGTEVLAFLPHKNGVDWVAWIPSGYYMSSINGDSLIGWHLNNGLDQAPDFYRAVQFERVLYRPDIVQQYFRSFGEIDVRALLKDATAFRIDGLRARAPPKVEIRNLAVQSKAAAPNARFTLNGTSVSIPIEDYTVFVNDIPVTPHSERTLPTSEAQSFQRAIEVPLLAASNQVRIEAFNGESMGVTETVIDLEQAPVNPPRGDLYLVAVGVNDFADNEVRDLKFAAQDAEELAKYFLGTAGTTFEHVHVRIASDHSSDKPTRNTVRQLLNFVAAATARDTVIVFLASHGLSDKAGTYYFVPADVQMADVRQLSSSTVSPPPSLIPWQVFFDAMRGAAGRRLLIVDTCNAGDMRGTMDVHALAKRSAASRFALVAASRGDEKSQEYPAGGHGLFTFGLLQALREGADVDADGMTTLREAFAHAFEVVRRQRPNANLPQTPQLEAPPVLESTVLSSALRSVGRSPDTAPSGELLQ